MSSGSPFSNLGHYGPPNWQRATLTSAQKTAICTGFTDAVVEEPTLSKSEYARRIAAKYGVTAATIRNILVGVPRET